MKRAKATKAEKKQIKAWLQEPFDIVSYFADTAGNRGKIIAGKCPFSTVLIMCPLEDQPYCKKFFPKLEKHCPCMQFPIKYVRRVARELIK